MKIAYFVSNRATFPLAPGQIAASMSVVSNIIRCLSRKHEITVYAAKGSKFEGAKIVDLGLEPFQLDSNIADSDWVTKAVVGMKQIYVGALLKNAYKYDIVNFHTEPIYLGMPMVSLVNTPILFTIHNIYHDFEKTIFSFYDGKVNLSALSKSHAKSIPFTQKIPVIYNGVEVDEFPFNPKDEDYFLFMGRLHQCKGIDAFLKIAKSRKDKLFYIAGKGSDYYEDKVKKICNKNNNIKFYGMAPRKSELWFNLLSKAKALILPTEWDEPFGLVPVEAMACGTPVVTYDRGAAPELLQDGQTGYLISPPDKSPKYIVRKVGIEGMLEAVDKIDSLSENEYKKMRQQSRANVEERFTTHNMVQGYENLYKKIIKEHKEKKKSQ